MVVPGAGGQLRQPPIGKFVALAVFWQRVKVIKGVGAIFVHRRNAHGSYLPPAQTPHGVPTARRLGYSLTLTRFPLQSARTAPSPQRSGQAHATAGSPYPSALALTPAGRLDREP